MSMEIELSSRSKTILNNFSDYSFILTTVFFVLRLLFFISNHSAEMFEEFLYSVLFEMLAFNLISVKYFSADKIKTRLSISDLLTLLTIVVSLLCLDFVLFDDVKMTNNHFSSFGSFSIQSVLCFILLSLSLHYSQQSRSKSKIKLAQILAFSSLFLSIVSLFIHLFEIDLHKDLFVLCGMNATATLVFTVLSIGCLSINYGQGVTGFILKSTSISRIIRHLILFTISVPFILGWLSIHYAKLIHHYDSGLSFFITIFLISSAISVYIWYGSVLVEEKNIENRRLHNKLLESEKYLKEALESSSQGTWTFDYRHNKIIFDQMSLNILSFAPIGFSQTLPWFLDLLHEREKFELRHLLLSNDYTKVETDIQMNTPWPCKWIRLKGQKIFDEDGIFLKVIGTLQDVTTEKSALIALKTQEETLRIALDAGEMGLFEWDLSTNLVKLSQKSKDIFRIEGDQTHFDLGLIHSLIVDEDIELVKNAYEVSVREKIEVSQYEYRLKQLSSEERVQWIGYRGKTFFDPETRLPVRMMGVLFDETRLRHSMVDLRKEKEMREKFVSTLTHDLRNVLNVCLLYNQMIRKHDNNPSLITSYALKAEASIYRGTSMIKDLLDLSLFIEKEIFPLKQKQEFHVNELLDDVKDSFPDLNDILTFTSAENLVVCWSKDDMKRVFENLIGNARKYGEADGKIAVDVQKLSESVLISFHNFGQAISQETISNLFRFLVRAEQASQLEGWGIGLSIVKGIVSAHGGKVSVESSAKKGTTFFLELPLEPRDAIFAS